MNIALISYEYPPDTAIGGIGTYMYQLAKMMRDRSHRVEVFSGSNARTGSFVDEGICVHRVPGQTREDFCAAAGDAFAARHREMRFDVLEGPEFGAEAAGAVEQVPDIPLVVKLHTPSFFVRELNRRRISAYTRLRARAGALLHKARRRGWLGGDDDRERQHVLDADEITSPSTALADVVSREWRIARSRICYLPNPYTPSQELLRLTTPRADGAVTFLGRLETRKGVIELAKAVPLVLRECPYTKFRLIGRPSESPHAGLDMRDYLSMLLGEHVHAVEFVGAVPYQEVPYQLHAASICVFPSRWENFPNVCLEAMAAGRAVVGTSSGGMADMLDNGKAGVLIRPRSPTQIADAVLRLLRDTPLMLSYAENARRRVLSDYSADRLGPQQERSYARAIEQRRALGPRRPRA